MRLEDASRDATLRPDLVAEAEDGGPDALLTPEMLTHLEELTGPTAEGGGSGAASPGRVVIVPGLMASALADTRRRGRGLIWVNPLAAVTDRLTALRLGPYDGSEDDHDARVRVDAIGPLPVFYDLLRLALERRGAAVEVFAFDWRRDLDIAAWRLADRLRRLGAGDEAGASHLVAHSQGALVARRALQILGPSEARRLAGRLVLIGPTNFGMFAAVQALAGGHDRIGLLGRLAVEPPAGFRRVLASFSSLYQLIPWDEGRSPGLADLELGRPSAWGAEATIDAGRLRRFLGWGRGLDTSFFDDRTAVILGAGRGRPTAGGVRIDGPGSRAEVDRELPGDGLVPHAMAVLRGVPTYLADGVEHALLAADRGVIMAVVALLSGEEAALPRVSSEPGDHRRVLIDEARPQERRPARLLQSNGASSSPPTLNGRFLSGYDRERARPTRSGGEAAVPERPAGTARFLQAGRPVGQSVPDRLGAAVEAAEPPAEPSNLLPFHFLRDGDRLGRAVVKLQRRDGAVGTGFLVAPDVLLTNHHVLPNRATAATARALANYEACPPEEAAGRAAVARLEPDTLFVTNAELDFTFCAVSGLEFLGVVPMGRDSLVAGQAECVNIIQHPRGRPKEVALQDNRVVDADNLVIQYVCDTEPGSSGSPVFDNDWTLVALHHASIRAGADAVDGASPGGRYLNEGVRLSAIAAWLETDDAESSTPAPALGRLRAAFRGPDPQIGFFGGLGRRGLGRSAAETVIELYRGGPGDLDLGFWDLGGPGRPALNRRGEVASVLAEMGVDLWCLTHVDPIEARGLLDELRAVSRLEYDLLVGRGDVPLCFLYRRSADLSVQGPPAPEDAVPGVRIGATTATGRPYRLQFVPLLGPDRPIEPLLRVLRDPARFKEPKRDDSEPAHDWLLIGGFDARGMAEREETSPAGAVGELLLAAGPEHALALLTSPESGVDRVFATPNVVPLRGASSRLTIAHDRPLPGLARALGPRAPIALRLSLHKLPADAAPVGAAPTAGSDVDPGPTELETTLLEALRPLIARLLAESRG